MTDESSKDRFFGCCLAFVSAVTLALQALSFTYIQDVYFMESLTIRMSFILLLILPYLIVKKLPVFGEERWELKWLLLNGVCFAGELTLHYYALILLPYADVAALVTSGFMIMAPVCARLILKEPCGLFEFVVVVAVIVGTVLVAQPKALFALATRGAANLHESVSQQLVGTGVVLLSCFCNVWVYLCARRLCHLHYTVTTCHACVWTIAVTAAFTTVNGAWSVPRGWDWLYLSGFAVVGFVAVTSLYQALRLAEASAVGTIKTSEIAVSYALQVTLVGVYPTIYSALGAVLISSTSFACGLRAWLQSRNASNDENAKLLTDVAVVKDNHDAPDASSKTGKWKSVPFKNWIASFTGRIRYQTLQQRDDDSSGE